MANPILVDCSQGEWTKVATNVTTGQVHRINKKPSMYLQTYRMTGNDSPTARTEGIPLFINSESEEISAAAGIDVYVMAIGNDGQVRVDV